MDFNLVQQLREASPFQPISDEESADRKAVVAEKEAEERRVKEERRGRVEEMYKSIPWDGLEAKLNEVLGTPITITVSRSNSDYILWQGNEELISKAGIFQATLRSVKVAVFNSTKVYELAENNCYWCNAHLHYEHLDGGTNGSELFTAWYDFGKKSWVFRLARRNT